MTLQQERAAAARDKKFILSKPESEIDRLHNGVAEVERGMEWARRELCQRWTELTPEQQREFSDDAVYAFEGWAASGAQRAVFDEMDKRRAAGEFSTPGSWENIN